MALRNLLAGILVVVSIVTVQCDLRQLAIANNDFALKMYRQLSAGTSENIFISPLSLSSAFAMLYYGARGRTAEELQRTLGYSIAGLSSTEVHSSFRAFLNNLLSSRDYVLNSANSILVDDSLNLDPNYRKEVQQLYDAMVQDVSFANEGPQLVAQINSWVSSKTNGKIKDLVSQIDPSSVLILLNAVYFKGTWETKFNPQVTFPESFYNYGQDKNETKVLMMHNKGKFPFMETPDMDVLELPYKGDHIAMLILLPKARDGLPQLERNIDVAKLSEIRSQLQTKLATISIPKFKMEYNKELSGQMLALGAGNIFRPGADFGGLTTSRDLVVSEIRHKAVLEVNEEGSEAAGATGIFIARTSLVRMKHFIVNHPFLFAIVDKRNDMILFMGSVKSF